MNRTIVRPIRWIRRTSSKILKSRYHDCAVCPCSWEDRSYEGECSDCGCVAYRDLYGDRLLCQLPDWAKRMIRERHDRKRDAAMAREYDGMADYFMEQERKDTAMLQALHEMLPGTDMDFLSAGQLRRKYEDTLKEMEMKTTQNAL